MTASRRDYGGLDAFILLTPGLADEVREVMRDNKHTKVVAIPNFLEHYPEKLPEHREKTVVAVGRLVEVKGMDRLIRIFAAVHEKAPDWNLRIIGEGDERPALEALIREQGLSDCVTLTGKLSPEGVEREMLSASIYASTSKSEGFMLTLVEGMSCGLAPVAYDVRVGPALIITDSVNGYLVPTEMRTGMPRVCSVYKRPRTHGGTQPRCGAPRAGLFQGKHIPAVV